MALLMHLSLYIPTYHSAGKGWGFVWDYEGNASPRGGEFTWGYPRLKINASMLLLGYK